MPTKAKLSQYGLNSEAAVDVAALSDHAAARPLTFAVPVGSQPLSANTAYFVINASTDHVLGPVGVAGTIVAASISSARVASLGTGSFSLYKSTDGSSKTLITNTIDPETASTVNVARAFTMVTASSANVVTAGDCLFLRCTADNNTVTTDVSSVRVTVWIVPTDSTPTRGGSTWGS